MYFDHCEKPADLRRAITDFMKIQTGRRISAAGVGKEGMRVRPVDEHTDQTLRQGYAEAQATAERMKRANPELADVPSVSVVPLEGLAVLGRWCADAERVKADPKGTGVTMYFAHCESPRALCDDIKMFLKSSGEFARRYAEEVVRQDLTAMWAMGSIQNMERRRQCLEMGSYKEVYRELAPEVYRDACTKAIELREADPRLPQPPIGAADPVAGLQLIMQWCIEAGRVKRGNETPGGTAGAGATTEHKPKRGRRPERKNRKKTPGRKPLNKTEIDNRTRVLAAWKKAGQAHVSRQDFCEDKGIEVRHLEKYQAWERQRKARGQ